MHSVKEIQNSTKRLTPELAPENPSPTRVSCVLTVPCRKKVFSLNLSAKWREILWYIPPDDNNLLPIAHRVIAGIALRARPAELLQLDQRIRNAKYEIGLSWNDVERFIESAKGANVRLGLLAVAASQADGRIRESAVRMLAQACSGQELPFLLLRLDDKVAEIRELAIEAIKERVCQKYLLFLIECLPLLAKLKRRTRAFETQVPSFIESYLLSSKNLDELIPRLREVDVEARREILALLANSSRVPSRNIIEAAMCDPDRRIRYSAFSIARDRFEGDDLFGLLVSTCSNSDELVRREAIDAMAFHFHNAGEPLYAMALVDRAPAVRAAARFHLSKRSNWDFRKYYQRVLSWQSDYWLLGAIGGLSETGNLRDTSYLIHFLHHRSVRISRSALRAICVLEPNSRRFLCLKFLMDPRVGMVSQAFGELATARPRSHEVEQIWEAVVANPSDAGKLIALKLLRRLPFWAALPRFLEATAHATPTIRSFAFAQLERWLKPGTRLTKKCPPVSQLNLAQEALQRAQSRLDLDTIARLQRAIDQSRTWS